MDGWALQWAGLNAGCKPREMVWWWMVGLGFGWMADPPCPPPSLEHGLVIGHPPPVGAHSPGSAVPSPSSMLLAPCQLYCRTLNPSPPTPPSPLQGPRRRRCSSLASRWRPQPR